MLTRYRVEKPITLRAGVIGLTKDQAHPRLRSLEKKNNSGMYNITGQVQFVAGEIIRLDSDLIAPVANNLTDLTMVERVEAL